MKKNWLLLFLFTWLCIVGFNGIGSLYGEVTGVTETGRMYVPGMFIIKFTEQSGNIESSVVFSNIMAQYHVERAEKLFPQIKFSDSPKKQFSDLSRIYRMNVADEQDMEQVCSKLRGMSGIEYAEPVYIEKVERIPNDKYYGVQLHLPQIMAPEAWDIAIGDTSVIIAIIDTGVDWTHPDLAANIWVNKDEVLDGTDTDGNGFVDDIRGWDYVEGVTDFAPGEDPDVPDNDPMDFDGHGTHVSGCATAITDNEEGVASIGWGCTIMPLRCGWQASDRISGYLRMDWLAQAVVYAANNGAHVLNISTGSSEAVADAGRYAFNSGMVITKSAGNADNEEADPLELRPFTLSVAAVDDRDYRSSYSSYGDWVKVSAPGGDQNSGRPGIFSTVVTRYAVPYTTYQGTSMSAPIVAGLAGLIKSYHPDWSNVDIIKQIINTADNIDALNPAYAGKLGAGRINAHRALTEEPLDNPRMKLISTIVDDSEAGNGNGVAEIGEELSIVVNLENTLGNASNVQARLVLNDWAIEIIDNVSDFGDIPGLSDLDHNRVDNASDPFVIRIDSLALPHRINGLIEVVADDYMINFDFTFSIAPAILLVDDEELDNEKYYIEALENLNLSYDYWDHNLLGTPPNLNGYSTVIWSCEWTFPSLDSTDIVRISDYLDNGGNFFLSGQDIGWDMSDPGGTTFLETDGFSQTFFEDYLHARYLLDDSEFSSLSGVNDDPIGDGLSFTVFQPGRDAENQYPDEIEPAKGAHSIFDYANGSSGAVRYAGSYRSVYFSFGGYEAIVEDDVRIEVMQRVLDWLNGLEVVHAPLKDTEDTANDYRVEVKVTSQAMEIGVVRLLWDNDGELPFSHKIDLADMGDGIYEGYIPAQAADTDMIYSIFVTTENGYYSPPVIYNFFVGQDLIAPVFDYFGFPQTFIKAGSFNLTARILDNSGIDENSVMAYYMYKNSSDSLQMLFDSESDQFGVGIDGQFSYGDTVSYYISASDIAAIPNKTISSMKYLIIGSENFETGLDQWETDENGWGIETDDPVHGTYISDSPYTNYQPGTNNILELKVPLDLSDADSARLSFATKYRIQPAKVAGIIEMSPDSGATWIQIGSNISGIKPSWTRMDYSLRNFLGQDHLMLRFRLESDPTAGTNYDGWFIDDISIVERLATDVEPSYAETIVPQRYDLAQNHPNPFNPETQISYQLATTGRVSIRVYNALGQLVRTLVNERKYAGVYTSVWDGKDDHGIQQSSGVYFYQMRVNDFVQTRKMLILK
ncbi:S8 family serine peptidase [candidate division KSB1 bacterium]|nr:S8 family serine peptidase [candidate division KSB1 bacterium]